MSSWGPNQKFLVSLCPRKILSLLFLPCVFISHQRIIVHSLRLVKEVQTLIPPYIGLDFDQNVRKGLQEVTATIGELQSLEHLATYGRPLYAVLIHLQSM